MKSAGRQFLLALVLSLLVPWQLMAQMELFPSSHCAPTEIGMSEHAHGMHQDDGGHGQSFGDHDHDDHEHANSESSPGDQADSSHCCGSCAVLASSIGFIAPFMAPEGASTWHCLTAVAHRGRLLRPPALS